MKVRACFFEQNSEIIVRNRIKNRSLDPIQNDVNYLSEQS